MPADGTEFVSLAQLKDYDDNRVTSGLDVKLNAPASDGTNGQMLVYGDDGNQWTDVPESTAYSADDETLQLSGTQFSVKDGGINAAKIANGAITADKLASGVIPDVSGFITQTTADDRYAAKSHTHEISQVTGLQNALDDKLTQEAANELYAAKSHTHEISQVTGLQNALDDKLTQEAANELYAAKSHTHEISQVTGLQNALDDKLTQEAANELYAAKSHTHANATTDADGFMSSEDKTKLDGLQDQIDETKRLKPVNEIVAGTDLDTLTEPGSWFCDDSTSVTNVPGGVAAEFLLYVYSGEGRSS